MGKGRREGKEVMVAKMEGKNQKERMIERELARDVDII